MKRLRAALASLLVIAAVALCLRLGYGWDYVQHRPHRALGVIPFLFEPGNIAASLVSGKGFSSPFRVDTGPTAWLTPVYPLLLAGIFRIFGLYTFQSFATAAVLNILFSAGTCIPIYYAGWRLGGTRVAVIATWLWAVFPNAIKLPVEAMWDTSLAALLAACILWATLALDESRRAADWCAYGLLWGLALMTNPTLLSLLPFLLGWLVYRSRRYGHAALAAGMIVLCCTPWTIRNYEVFHRFVPLRSVVPLTLWLGNHDQSSGAWVGRLHPITNTEERAKYVELGEIAYMQDKQQEAVQFMKDHPWDELRACWYRFVVIWTGGSAHPLDDFGGVLLFNVLVSIGALAGVVVLFRARSHYAFPLAVFPIVFPCAYYLTLASARYRHPMDPVLLLLAAVAVSQCVSVEVHRACYKEAGHSGRGKTMKKRHRPLLPFLIFGIAAALSPAFGQVATCTKVSLRGTGSPRFPTGYWLSPADPHFRHSQDRLFWLDSGKIAITFFDGYCCGSSSDLGVKFRAAVFDTAGNRISTHDWISKPDKPFYIGGHGAFFWARYTDHIELLTGDYASAGALTLVKGSYLVWSKSDDSWALVEGSTVTLYGRDASSPPARFDIPAGTELADTRGHSVLLNTRSSEFRGVKILDAALGQSWGPSFPRPSTINDQPGPSGVGLLSEDAVVVERYQDTGPDVAIVCRDGRVDPVAKGSPLLVMAGAGRIALQVFRANPLADVLDMDFGGRKVVAVYDSTTKRTLFRRTINGQAGAALSPDGHHLAVVEDDNLLIYDLP